MSERIYDEEEKIAIHRYEQGEELLFSTDISESISYGYGTLDYNGFWEYPLPYEYLKGKDKELIDSFRNVK